jgi:Na+-driven multidrug efflux pump
MSFGAVINIGLDALFVSDWGFNWGMAGAAGATAVSQIISCVVAFCYITRFKSVHVSIKSFAFNIRKIIKIASLGMSNCINQVAICGVQIVMNNQLDTYGILEFSKELAHIPQAAFGVVMKVNSLLISFFVGMAQGSQPIVGFNYGARKLHRSKKTFLMAASACFTVALIGFIVFQTVPQSIISIFGSGIKEYNEFAEKTMRIFLSMIMLNGVQMTIANYFSAIGKPIKGAILSLTRQVLLIIPLMLILPKFLGLDGVLYAAPITDFLAFLLALVFALFEFKRPEYKNK